jgi:hypothetical protein
MAGRKPKSATVRRSDFAALLADVKGRIQAAQTRAVLAVNAELVRLYWDIGRLVADRQRREGWGAAVIPRLARELHNELPDLKGFSERNIKLMVQFASAYPHAFPTPDVIGQPAVAQLPDDPKGQLPVAQVQRRQRPPQAARRSTHHRPHPLPGARQIAGGIQLRRHRQADRHLDYELTRTLPRALRSALPTVEEIEAELSRKPRRRPAGKTGRAKVRRSKT